jgi:hypothetical protein
MNTANSGMQACRSSPAVKQYRSVSVRTLHFLSRLLAYTIAAFALATLVLFGLNTGLGYVTPGAGRAAPAQQHAGLPAFAEKLAEACWQGPTATMLAPPAARCMAMASMTMQHLLGAAGADGLGERLGVVVAGAAVSGLQKAVRLTAPAWLGYGRSGGFLSIH